ncbi:MAG: TetR family transcriptional regulator [Candidatus Nanopelagicales bacterium]
MSRATPRPTTRPIGRRPGESGARDDILHAARELFAAKGFERATIRAIAERAGVDPALVHHYFGTKDELLVAAVDLPVDPVAVLGDLHAGMPGVGETIVARALGLWDSPQTQGAMVALLRTGISHDRAAQALRDVLSRTLLHGLEGLADADRPELRAALVGSQMGGLLLARYVIGIPPLKDLPAQTLAGLVGPVLDHYLQGPLV